MTTGELGTWLAMSTGLFGAIGVFTGGMIADKLAPRDKRWYMWIPAGAGAIAIPFMIAVMLVPGQYSALILAFIPGLMYNVYLGNCIATTHGLVGQRMRATSSAILFLILNIIGLGLGPFSIGVLSDFLAPSLGTDSLRYAMLILIPGVTIWSVLHFYLASRTLQKDLAAAPD